MAATPRLLPKEVLGRSRARTMKNGMISYLIEMEERRSGTAPKAETMFPVPDCLFGLVSTGDAVSMGNGLSTRFSRPDVAENAVKP